MIAAATTRNADHVAAGRATFLARPSKRRTSKARFDKVFGIHFPPADRHDPEGTRARVAELLAPGGVVRWF